MAVNIQLTKIYKMVNDLSFNVPTRKERVMTEEEQVAENTAATARAEAKEKAVASRSEWNSKVVRRNQKFVTTGKNRYERA